MIENEQINIINYSTGTTAIYFTTTTFFQNIVEFEAYNSFLTFTNLGLPYQLGTFDGKNMLIRNNENNYVELSSTTTNYITGYTYITKMPDQLEAGDKATRIEQFLSLIDRAFSGQASTNYVFFQEENFEDFHVNVSLNRTYSMLDTLSIYNRATGRLPTQESSVGTVFGKLMANQKIRNEFGGVVRIPLRNVPVGIFNASDEFPTPSSIDDNGNRIILNLQNNSEAQDYFNLYSYSADTAYLPLDSTSLQVPDKFKYVTFTNDNGEFVLHNVPIGSQLLVFEVDLFKQGLTAEEIFLNRGFPFPSTDFPNIDSVPAYYFRQIPINIVPTWGKVQTGYTEVNINVDLDLRKWATFFVSPVATSSPQYATIGENEVANLNELNAFDSIPLTVSIRDMSLDGYPIKDIKLVEVGDIFNRKQNAYAEWNNEFVQLKSSAEFRDRFYSVFKVPGNLYDPNGYSTDISGFTTSKKGVWLAAYQYKMFLDAEDRIFRTTGLERQWLAEGGYTTRDNYHLNRSNSDTTLTNIATKETSVGTFPYERAWTINYPEPYRIPSIPTIKNYDHNSYLGRYSLLTNSISTSLLPIEQPYAVEQPKYIDGDLVGIPYAETGTTTNSGGWALQIEDDDFTPNSFSRQVTKSYLYKYERGVSWHEEYSNGYQPTIPFIIQPGISSVVNGETFQRVECGYAYLLKPEGWPIVCHLPKTTTATTSSFDVIYPPELEDGVGLNDDSGPSILPALSTPSLTLQNVVSHINDVYELARIQTKLNAGFALAMDESTILKEGSLDIYRLIHPDVVNKKLPNTPTFMRLNFQEFKFQRGTDDTSGVWSASVNGESTGGEGQAFYTDESNTKFQLSMGELRLEITNNGTRAVRLSNNDVISNGDSSEIGLENNKILQLDGNDQFNYTTNKYERASYSLKFKNLKLYNNSGAQEGPTMEYSIDTINLSANTANDMPDYYLITYLKRVRTNKEAPGGTCTGSFLDLNNGKIRDIKHNGPSLINRDQPWTDPEAYIFKLVFENQRNTYSNGCGNDGTLLTLEPLNSPSVIGHLIPFDTF